MEKLIPGSEDFEVTHHPLTEFEEPDAFAKIKAFCDSSGESDMLGLYRALPGKKEQYVAKIGASEFDPERIRLTYGGGDYIIKAYDDRSKIRLKQHISIEGEPIIQSQQKQGAQNSQAFDPQSMLALMQENNRQMLTGLAQIMAPALQQKTESRGELLNDLIQMKALVGGSDNSGGMEMLLKGIELAKSITPREGEPSGMEVLLETVKNVGPALGAVLAQNQNAARRPVHAQPKPAIRQIAQPSQAPEVPQIDDEETMLFRYYINMLVGHAKANKDPALYADLILDNMSDEQLNNLLSRPDLIGEMAVINVEVAAHRQWFEQLLHEIKAGLGLTEEGNGDSVAAPNDLQPENADTKNGNNSTT